MPSGDSPNFIVQGRWMMGVILMAFALLVSCDRKQSPPPITYPVKGQLIVEEGPPPPNTTIQFIPVSSQLRARGTLDNEGKFTLFVISDSQRYEGAVQGLHQVKVVFPLGSDRKGASEVLLGKKYLVKPQANEFILALPRKSK